MAGRTLELDTVMTTSTSNDGWRANGLVMNSSPLNDVQDELIPRTQGCVRAVRLPPRSAFHEEEPPTAPFASCYPLMVRLIVD